MAFEPKEIIDFWVLSSPEKWFVQDNIFDQTIMDKYGALPDQIISGHYDRWGDCAQGALALILSLDQFPRHMYRGRAQAFHYDEYGRQRADHAIQNNFDDMFDLPLKRFFYLPFMHSEIIDDQQRCIDLCAAASDHGGVKFAELHRDIIHRFGRFPHRNQILGRCASQQEIAFLADGGFKG